jgi:hypothetical protein
MLLVLLVLLLLVLTRLGLEAMLWLKRVEGQLIRLAAS